MKNRSRAVRSLLASVVPLVVLSGCAGTGVVPNSAQLVSENPAAGPAVRIAGISDDRIFQSTAAARFVPSLTGDDSDPARRARAIGRTNLTNGRPGANVFLEEGLTIHGLVRGSVTAALRRAGFRVLEPGDDGHAQAVPVEVAIERLWMMKSPPSASPYTDCDLSVRISGPIPGLETGLIVEARGKIVRGGFTRAMWRLSMDKALASLTDRATPELERARSALAARPSVAPPPLIVVDRKSESHADQMDFGKYYLLAIGIDDYDRLPRLKTAVSDARAIASLLETAYGFETELLLDATRGDLIRALGAYRDKVGPKDNLLIYFAGHGWNDEEANLGYWLPADADPDDETNWVSNAKVTSMLRAMKAKHVMVVSDSCYSGTLTRGLRIERRESDHLERLASRRTRLALTSGGNEPVIDGGGGGHSVFANALLRSLRENESILDATTLHARIREPIMRDSSQTPQFGPIRTARHEDGDFLFVRIDDRTGPGRR